MANVKLIFCDYENEQVQLRCYANTGNDIYIQIEDLDVAHDYNCQYICLDKATAIKLSKTLKSAINEIE